MINYLCEEMAAGKAWTKIDIIGTSPKDGLAALEREYPEELRKRVGGGELCLRRSPLNPHSPAASSMAGAHGEGAAARQWPTCRRQLGALPRDWRAVTC